MIRVKNGRVLSNAEIGDYVVIPELFFFSFLFFSMFSLPSSGQILLTHDPEFNCSTRGMLLISNSWYPPHSLSDFQETLLREASLFFKPAS